MTLSTRRLCLLVFSAALMPLAVAAWHGLGRPFTLTPDADLIYMGEALRALDGRPYFYTDHPGYTYTLLLSGWLKLLHMIGIIQKPGLAAALAAPAIDSFLQSMIWAGRLLSATLAALLVAAAAFVARQGGLSRGGTVFFAFALAASSGIAHQTVILRAELLSGGLCFLCFGAVSAAARRGGWTALLWLGLAGFLAAAAMAAKVQAIIPLAAIPALALAIEALEGPRGPGGGDGWLWPATLAALAVVLPMATVAVFSRHDFTFAPAVAPYPLALIVWVCGAMAVYGRLHRIPVANSVLGALALACGGALGLSTLFLRHSHRVVDAVINPIEHMRAFSAANATGGIGIGQALAEAAERLAVNFLIAPPSLMLRGLELAALVAAFLLARRRHRRPAVLVLLLTGTAVAVELVFGLRGTFSYYLIYLDAWVLLAVTVAGERLAATTTGRKWAMAAAAAAVMASAARALAPDLVPVQPPANLCVQADIYLEAELAARLRPLCPGG